MHPRHLQLLYQTANQSVKTHLIENNAHVVNKLDLNLTIITCPCGLHYDNEHVHVHAFLEKLY